MADEAQRADPWKGPRRPRTPGPGGRRGPVVLKPLSRPQARPQAQNPRFMAIIRQIPFKRQISSKMHDFTKNPIFGHFRHLEGKIPFKMGQFHDCGHIYTISIILGLFIKSWPFQGFWRKNPFLAPKGPMAVHGPVLTIDQNVTFFPRFTFYLTEKGPKTPAFVEDGPKGR